jgi:hypothetical protein
LRAPLSSLKGRIKKAEAANPSRMAASCFFPQGIYSVRPVHARCGQVQSMSGVFSIASHCGLQYSPEVTVQEQMGCAHFLPSVFAMNNLLYRCDPKETLNPGPSLVVAQAISHTQFPLFDCASRPSNIYIK